MRYRLDLKLPHIQTTFIRAMSQLTSLPQTPSNSLPPLYKMRHAASDLSKEGDLGPHETALVDALNALHECSVSLHLFVVLFISFDCSMRGSRVTHVMHVNASSAGRFVAKSAFSETPAVCRKCQGKEEMEVPESWREYACATVFNYSPRELDMILQVLSFSRQLVAALESHREELAGKLAGSFYDETQEVSPRPRALLAASRGPTKRPLPRGNQIVAQIAGNCG